MMAGMILCRRWSCWWRSVWAVVDLTWVLGMPFAASLSASHRALSFLVNTWIHLSPLLFWHQSIVEKKRPLSLLGLVTLWMGWSGYCKIHFKLALCTCKEIIVSEYFFFHLWSSWWKRSWAERMTNGKLSVTWQSLAAWCAHMCQGMMDDHLLSVRNFVWCRWSWSVWSMWEGAHWCFGLTDQSDERGPHRLCTGKQLPIMIYIIFIT